MVIALKTIDIRNDFKRVSDIVNGGEPVLISRPHNNNLVVLSETAYNELARARHNADYLDKIGRSLQELKHGKVVVKTIEDLEAME
jgi:antitoxin YefM